MKGFLIKIVFFIIILASLYGILIHKLSQGYVDIYYNKFTQDAGGLILGLSKASNGINPKIIENELKSINYDTPIVNFALNVSISRYGDVYLEDIKNKLKSGSNKQLFIMSVSPLSFGAVSNIKDTDIIEIDKNHTILGKVSTVNKHPNYNYIRSTYSESLYNSFNDYNKWSHFELHKNGWIEIKLIDQKLDTINSKDTKSLKSNLIKYFKQNLKNLEVSNYRINSFIKTIQFLKSKGDVFIIYIPEDKEFINMEYKFFPDFEFKIDSITKKQNVPFLNYSSLADKFKTFDGLHFESESANKFTKILSNDILLYLKKNPAEK